MKVLNWVKEQGIKIWDKANGNKTTIGTILWLASYGAQAFFPTLLTTEQYKFIEYIGMSLSGAGLAHKGVKEIDKKLNKIKIKK